MSSGDDIPWQTREGGQQLAWFAPLTVILWQSQLRSAGHECTLTIDEHASMLTVRGKIIDTEALTPITNIGGNTLVSLTTQEVAGSPTVEAVIQIDDNIHEHLQNTALIPNEFQHIPYDDFLHGSPDAIAVVDESEEIRYANTEFAELFDAETPETLRGLPFSRLCGCDHPNGYARTLDAARAKVSVTETWDGTVTAQNLDGETQLVDMLIVGCSKSLIVVCRTSEDESSPASNTKLLYTIGSMLGNLSIDEPGDIIEDELNPSKC